MQSTLLDLYSKSERFFLGYLLGEHKGRKLNLWDFFAVHFHTFSEIAQTTFFYDGLPYILQKEIEKRLFFFGRCGIVKENGELIAVNANGNGENVYGFPTHFTFTFRNGTSDASGRNTPYSREIGKNGVYARNTYDLFPTALDVEQIALMLAHDDTSILCENVNGRFMDVLISHSNADAESARQFTNDLYCGKISHITDKTEDLEINREARGATSRLKDLLDVREYHLQQAYEMFGIQKIVEKKERMITDEIGETETMLRFNIKDMLDQRAEMCQSIQDVFGVDCSVRCRIDVDGDGKKENEEEAERGEEIGEDIIKKFL